VTTERRADTTDVTLVDGYVPIIDLGLPMPVGAPRGNAVAEAIRRACETSGFFVIVGHGVLEKTIADMYSASREFFGQREESKRAIAVDPVDTLQRGWESNLVLEKFCATRLGENEIAEGNPARDQFLLAGPNRWPELPGFRDVFLSYYAAMEELALTLMRLIALALKLPERWFDDKFENHMSPLALNYYVPQLEPPVPGSLRNEPHIDFGTVTILYQDDAPGGLQVRDLEGNWLDVPAIPGSFVVNLGRLMSMWTNGRWASTVHRVVHPPAEEAHRDRISIPFFHQPSPEAVVECIPTCTDEASPPRHAPITSGEYFVSRSRRLYVRRLSLSRGGPRPKGTEPL
jgi:isopenicillin N synthase-like dioxygenase